ncbi:glycosyltransferase family 2 protein [Hydromonas duriensis]|uniref:Glycosyltransferase involved in cell wall biosynthesis n=1 Tax=Hydromonas duriensis TaxID=1527608 RepID=A0A4R6Y464_9BURK|nr:glycosyltransferase family 2 protein [Hydromonas duriensis]TDR28819.1 glycosyltransferase involved in cell wall biosynthesis [Hydromonas duriensis]
MSFFKGLKVAVVIPCYNEEKSIGSVILDLKKVLPEASIYVFDNNSTDKTAEVAKLEGAHVINVALKGKGNVVRRMFADVEADIYVMLDGDATYYAPSSLHLIEKLCKEHLDMVVGVRVEEQDSDAYRRGHRWGNTMLTKTVQHVFGGQFTDMLSGYRVFSRRYAKSFPALSKGFEIETELTIHALELRMPYGELNTPYGERLEGSESKLSTYKDGFKILKTIFRLYMVERPMAFFSIFGTLFIASAISLSIPLLSEYLNTGLVPRLPTAILSSAMVLTGLLSFSCGFILETVTRGRNESKRLVYLSIPRTQFKDE